MSNLNPNRLYVEAQSGIACLTHALDQRMEALRSEDEAGFEIPANMIIMVGLIAVAIVFVAAVKPFVEKAIAEMKMP
ncbi:hypothetical protein [Luteococcus sp.]|uniref:hypothetical protein n=1 Tax=Luteococcus sp. TaxID=1969402 RepID=UPI003736F94D